jgi:hypothetical protein
MDYLAMMKEALAAADDASQTADTREGKPREMWLATADKFMDASRTFSLASIAESLADIANALRDDEGNNPAHILHNMSYTLAQIARNTGAMDNGDEPAISLKQLRADVDWLQRYAERN